MAARVRIREFEKAAEGSEERGKARLVKARRSDASVNARAVATPKESVLEDYGKGREGCALEFDASE